MVVPFRSPEITFMIYLPSTLVVQIACVSKKIPFTPAFISTNFVSLSKSFTYLMFSGKICGYFDRSDMTFINDSSLTLTTFSIVISRSAYDKGNPDIMVVSTKMARKILGQKILSSWNMTKHIIWYLNVIIWEMTFVIKIFLHL